MRSLEARDGAAGISWPPNSPVGSILETRQSSDVDAFCMSDAEDPCGRKVQIGVKHPDLSVAQGSQTGPRFPKMGPPLEDMVMNHLTNVLRPTALAPTPKRWRFERRRAPGPDTSG